VGDCQRYGAAGVVAALAEGVRLSRSFALPALPPAGKSRPVGIRPQCLHQRPDAVLRHGLQSISRITCCSADGDHVGTCIPQDREIEVRNLASQSEQQVVSVALSGKRLQLLR
jgi:hypothetical protein